MSSHWLVEFEAVGGKTGGHSVLSTEKEARMMAADWSRIRLIQKVVVTPVRYCAEDDPQVYAWDEENNRHLALDGLPDVVMDTTVTPSRD